MPVIGIREFSSKVSRYVAEVERSGEPVIVTRHGRPMVAMLPIDADRLRALTVAAAPRLIQDLAQADADLAAGRSRSLDDLIVELDEEDAVSRRVELPSADPRAAVELGSEYVGKVVKTTTFGAFIELAKGTDGLLHISDVSPGQRVDRVEDVLNKGDEVNVRVVEVDRERGRIGLRLAQDPDVAGETSANEHTDVARGSAPQH